MRHETLSREYKSAYYRGNARYKDRKNIRYEKQRRVTRFAGYPAPKRPGRYEMARNLHEDRFLSEDAKERIESWCYAFAVLATVFALQYLIAWMAGAIG